jgi:hypothetical protein
MTITNGYCTLSDLKAVMHIADSVDDDMLSARIEEASRTIDDYCDRRFYADASATARVFTSTSGTYVITDDISTTTSMVVAIDVAGNGTYTNTLTINSDFQVLPLNALAKGGPVTRIQAIGQGSFPTRSALAPIQVTAKWGWPSVPAPIKSATILMAGRLAKRGDALLGVAGFGEFGAINVRSVDPDVARLLAPYRSIAFA